MSIRSLSAPGHIASPDASDRPRVAPRFAPVLGYAVAGGASLLIWAAALSLGLQIVR